MAEFSPKRIVAIAVIASALVGGAVAGVVAVVVTGGNHDGAAASSGDSSSTTTAAVVRTTLATSVQVGGSIGFEGSYTIAAPSGTSAQQLAQAQQGVAKDQENLSTDEQAEADVSTADNQAIASAQSGVDAAQSTLSADQAKEAGDCAGAGASTPACSSDSQKVSQDQAQLTQANQQLASAQDAATRDHDQNQARVTSDQTQLQGDGANLASLQATAANPGTVYTALPAVGDVISQDQPVYSVSNEPVPLLYGSIAAYRAFSVSMSDGPDVGQLTQDLITLGYGSELTESNDYSSATAAAVERWQKAVGLPATGEILLGQVVFEPGPIRVTSVTPSVGGSLGGGGAGGGTVLTATGTTPIVTVDLDVDQEGMVKPGDAVSVVLPDSTTVSGTVETVGSVATCPGGGSTGTSSAADQSPCSSGGSTNTPTVAVTITLNSTPAGTAYDQAPVNVNITSQTADNVLAVPVTALLALQGGGFGVRVVTGRTSHLVGVSTGLYNNTLVQVSGSGLAEGMRVEVPSS